MFEKPKEAKSTDTSYFFDAQSTTPIDPQVLSVINEVFQNDFANPHSSHRLGHQANQVIETAKRKITHQLNCPDHEIIFTSGATESNNMIIKGLRDYLYEHQLKAVTVKTEHKCVLNSFDYLERNGVETIYLDVEKNGLLNLEKLDKHLDKVGLLSVMLVNNEIGVIQPLKKISEMAKKKGIILHSDVAQAMGRLPVDIEDLGLDAVSISGHKFYGPKGIGLAIISQDFKSILKPTILGGGQQSNLRSGTLPTPLCAGIAKSIELFQDEEFMKKQHQNHFALFKLLSSRLTQEKISYSINGILPLEDFSQTQRVASNLNIAFSQFEAISLMNQMSNFMISTGSACSAGEFDYSHVLKALNLNYEDLKNSVRISFTKDANINEFTKFIDTLISIHQK